MGVSRQADLLTIVDRLVPPVSRNVPRPSGARGT
jgi:hypothetical protein